MNRSAEPNVYDSLMFQAGACEHLGSPMYAGLLRALADNHAHGGVIDRVTRRTSARALRDAIALRLLGTVHRLVLSGEAPRLATHYPSVGGTPGRNLATDFVSFVNERFDDVAAGLEHQVQTNEVGRAAALAGGFGLIARRTKAPLDLLEIGSSAGLNLRWDRYWYETPNGACGDPDSSVRFIEWGAPPHLDGTPAIASRRGCDVAPLDASDPQAQLTLLSFVWPDQAARFERLRSALRLAAAEPVAIDQSDGADWLDTQFADRAQAHAADTAVVVFHSIVWQYVPPSSQERIRSAMAAFGARRPLFWLRLEPAGQVADIRLTTWPGGADELLGTAGYHGADVRWTGPTR